MGIFNAASTPEISVPHAWATTETTLSGYFPAMAVDHMDPPEWPQNAQGMVLISGCPVRTAKESSMARKASPDPFLISFQLPQSELPVPGAPVMNLGATKTE